ncbi:hypothetical protein ACUS6C_04220 [Pseudomonas aeruginosa]
MTLVVQAQRPVLSLRNQMMPNRLADLLGCAHTGYALDKCVRETEKIIFDNGGNKRFYGYLLHGVRPNADLWRKLIARFPQLAEDMENPLWLALHDLDECLWDNLAAGVTVGSGGFPGSSQRQMNRLCGVPSWDRLGVLLLVLRTKVPNLILHRLWLARNFTSYFALASLQSPFSYIAADIYSLVNEILGKVDVGESGVLWWPADEQEFEIYLDRMMFLASRLITNGWTRRMDRSGILLLWMVLRKSEYLDYLQLHEQRGRGERIPDALRIAWHRELQYLNDADIHIAGLENVKYVIPRL